MADESALPPALCRACADDAVAAGAFRNLCVHADQQWASATDYLTQIHHPTELDKAYFIFYGEENTIVKDQIDRVPNKEIALKRINSKFYTTPEKKERREKRRYYGKCSCPDCGKSFTVPEYLNRHLRNTLKRACIKCGLVLPKDKISKHLVAEHDMHYAECKICNSLFDSVSLLKEHVIKQHSENSHPCKICGNWYTSERALRAHLYSHSLFHCKACSESFESNKCLRHHQLQCKKYDLPPFNTFICDECGITYDRKPSLRIHMIQKHLNVLPYVCQTCGKRTSTLGHLRSHEKIHKPERKVFQCACGAKMRTELGFQLHQRIHTGERPYECEHCGDRFLSSSRRLDHIKRRHRGVKQFPHVCETCAARFVRPCELKKHYLTAHYTVVNVSPAKWEVNPVTKRMRTTYEKHIQEEPLIPIGACVTCASAALAAQEFRLFVDNSSKLWHKALTSLTTLPFSSEPPITSICAVIKPNDLSVQTFKDYDKSDPKTILNRIQNRSTKRVERKPRGARTGPPCSCPDCGKGFLSPHYLNQHLKNSGHKEACNICGSVCIRGKEMKKHLSSIHNEKTFLCTQCPLLFANETGLKIHLTKAHSPGTLTCAHCGRTFPRQASFDTHSQMHAVRTCRNCGVQFTNRGCYREHRSLCEPDARPKTHEVTRNRRSNIRDPAQFTCDYCAKTYNSRPQLKNHILWIHMDIRPHQCTWCGKRFYTPARLAEHTIVHTRVRNFSCDICGLKLVSKMAVVYHRRRHTGERPYECVDCGEKFISASRRSEHAKRRHNKGVRMQCLKCPASFVRKQELKKHIERTHPSTEENMIVAW